MADVRRLLDEIAAAATVAPLDDDLAGWHAKASPDVPFRRANAVLPPIGATVDRPTFEADLARVGQWCARLGQRLIVTVSDADPQVATLDAWLAEAGLVVEAPVHVLVADLIDLGRSLDERVDRDPSGSAIDPDARGTQARATVVEVRAGVDEAWARASAVIDGGDAVQGDRAAAYGRMLAGLGDRVLAARVADPDGATIGVGLGVIDGDWLGIFAMGTSPRRRRQGIASAIVRSLAEAASERGATSAYLQVETDNQDALACYRGLGFVRSHGYHYRSSGLDEAIGC